MRYKSIDHLMRTLKRESDRYSAIQCRVDMSNSTTIRFRVGFPERIKDVPILNIAWKEGILDVNRDSLSVKRCHEDLRFAIISSIRDVYISWVLDIPRISTLLLLYGGVGRFRDPANDYALFEFLNHPTYRFSFTKPRSISRRDIQSVLRAYSIVYLKVVLPYPFKYSFMLWPDHLAEEYIRSPRYDTLVEGVRYVINEYKRPIETWKKWIGLVDDFLGGEAIKFEII